MDFLGANTLVTQLLANRPEKAHDILVRCCEDDKVRQEITFCLLQSKHRQYETAPPANRFDITFVPSPSNSVHNPPHHTGPPLPHQRLPRRLSSNAPTYPLSPARTASSVTSHSTRDESGSGEYVLVPVFAGANKGDKAIRMSTAPIKYSVIREDVVVERNLNAAYSLRQAEEQQIYVPCREAEKLQLVSVEWCIQLTWRRPDSQATHSTLFYVVPKDILEPDMLLGFEDSGEETQDYRNVISSQSCVQQTQIFDPHLQDSMPPAPSYHRSAMTVDGSARSISGYDLEDQLQPPDMLKAFIAQQQLRGADQEAHQHQRNSPSPTVRRSHPSPTQHFPRLRANTTPGPSVQHSGTNTAINKIRLCIQWDETVISVWMDLNALADDFFQAFAEKAKKRKIMPERFSISIRLKNHKNMLDDESYDLSLDKEDLDADWETTLEWVNKHKRVDSPHIYGLIQIQDV